MLIKISFSLFIILAMLGSTFAQNRKIADTYNNGVTLQGAGKYDEALAEYEIVIKAMPVRNLEEVYLNRANIYLERGEKDKALADYTKFIETKTDNWQGYYNRGIAYYQFADYDKAILDFDKAHTLFPKFSPVLINRGNAKKVKGDNTGAFADYDKAVALSPNSYEGYYNRGAANFDLKKYDEALADYLRVVSLDAKNSDGHRMLGGVYYLKKEFDKAIVEFELAVQLGTENPEKTFAQIGFAKNEKGDKAGAIAAFTKSLELDANDADNFFARGLIYEEKEPAKAIDDYSKTIALNPRHAEAYARRGVLYIKQGKKAEAAKDISMAIRLNEALRKEYEPLLKTLGSSAPAKKP